MHALQPLIHHSLLSFNNSCLNHIFNYFLNLHKPCSEQALFRINWNCLELEQYITLPCISYNLFTFQENIFYEVSGNALWDKR